MAAPSCEPPTEPRAEEDVRWLALLIRQALLLVVAGIEKRYGLRRHSWEERTPVDVTRSAR
jgi:hypothetical protein